MKPDAENVVWAFGGPLTGPTPAIAWAVLAVAAVLGVAFVGWSYRRALVDLPVARRLALTTLRALLWLGLLVILAAPTRVRRIYADTGTLRPVAVLIDKSGSMTAPDNRQHRRLDDALRQWRELEPAARAGRRAVKTFVFARGLESGSADAKPPRTDATELFATLNQVLATAPGGGWESVVTLTDGLDTTDGDHDAAANAVVAAALNSGTALQFVAGRNRYAGPAFSGLRDLKVPALVAPKTSYHVEAVVDSFQTQARTLPVELSVNGQRVAGGDLRLGPGRRLATWSTDLVAGPAGNADLELKLGGETARAVVRIGRPRTKRILYFQGAMDWSYRFLADTLRTDTAFTLTPVFRFPDPSAVLPAGALQQMPATANDLEAFDVVVLANAAPSQFTDAQQSALTNWVRNGGVLLFFTPDDDSAGQFSGTELEKMLPVLFAPFDRQSTSAVARLAGLRSGYGPPARASLTSFMWEETERVHEVFAEAGGNAVGKLAPLFSEYAHVVDAKPGAEVLARHPSDVIPGTSEHPILLAIQRYGQGHSAVLTTDALWRWRLNEPTRDATPGLFWRTLFSWLTRQRESGLRFVQTPRVVEAGREVELRVTGTPAPAVRLSQFFGSTRGAVAEKARDGADHRFAWRASAEGMWKFTASDDQGNTADHWITVRKAAPTGELSGLPPDEELMRSLASRTGGAVLQRAAPVSWQASPPTTGALGEQREALWHRGWIFGLLVGGYAIELVLRRCWRLL